MGAEHHFGGYTGHLSDELRRKIERAFAGDQVSVTNYREPQGHTRGWFSCRNRGEPFNGATARQVLAYAHKHATGRDASILAQL